MQETITENVVRNSLKKDKRRWELATENRKLLETLYYFCNQITSGPMLLKFIKLIHPEWSKSTRERLLSELVRVKLLEQDYFLPSYKKGRVRVLFMTKYAVAFVLEHPDTSKVSMLPKKRRTDWRIETHILRSEMVYQFLLNTDYANLSMIDFRRSCVNRVSSYGLKGNDEYKYMARLAKPFVLEHEEVESKNGKIKTKPVMAAIFDGELYDKEMEYLYFVQHKRLAGLKAINKGVVVEPIKTTEKLAGTLSVSPNNKRSPRTVSLEKPLVEEPELNISKKESLRSVLSFMDIVEVHYDNTTNVVSFSLDYLVMHNSYSLEKVIENIAYCFKYFAFFINPANIQMQFNLYFANQIGFDDFNANLGTAGLNKALTEKGVLLPDNLDFLLYTFE